MIKLIIKNTHGKFFFDEASENEASAFKNLLEEKFTVRDSSLDRDYRVVRGLMSANKCFYNKEYDIIQSGLWPYVSAYAKKEGIQISVQDLRKFQTPNKKNLDKILKKGIGIFTQLRDFQKEALLACVKYNKGIICLPPGSGKSVIAGALTQIYDKAKFLFIFDRLDLINQTYKVFTQDLKISKDEIDIVGAGESDSTGARLIFLSMMSYKNVFPELPYIDVIVADEAHTTARTDTSEKIIFSCQNTPHTFGLSATPDVIGEDNPYEQMRLYANIGPIIYKRSFEEQQDAGTLATTIVRIHKIPCTKKLPIVGSWNDIYARKKFKTEEEKQRLIKEGYEIVKDAGDEIARKFVDFGDEARLYIQNEARNQKIVEIAESSERVLILFSKIKHGTILKELIPNAILISGKDDLQERNKAKDELQKNPKAIVIASSIFDVGVDLPAIKNLIIASSHINTSRIIQKYGRSTRKNESTGKLSAVIHDFDTSDNQIAVKQTKRKIEVYEKIIKAKMEYV